MQTEQLLYIVIGLTALNLILALMKKGEEFYAAPGAIAIARGPARKSSDDSAKKQ